MRTTSRLAHRQHPSARAAAGGHAPASRSTPHPAAAPARSAFYSWGNQAAQALLGGRAPRTKLELSQPGDVYEQEADRVADQVMRLADSSPPAAAGGPAPAAGVRIQRMCAECAEEAPAAGAHVQRMCAECNEEAHAQRQAADEERPQAPAAAGGTTGTKAPAGAAPIGEVPTDDVEEDASGMPQRESGASTAPEAQVHIPRQGGQPLDGGVRSFMEGAMGQSFGGVRVHTDEPAAVSARQLRAHAYTVGSDIYFNAGKYRPASPEGRRLLAHELTHVVQQSGGAPGAPHARRLVQRCPQGKQSKVVHDDCSTGEPADKTNFIRHLEVSLAKQKVTATWGPRSTKAAATRTDRWDCSPNQTHTPTGPDHVGLKCSENHTNMKRDGMAWFTGFESEGLRIGFHDSQIVAPGVQSHGCVRVHCGVAKTINANTWSGVTTINVA